MQNQQPHNIATYYAQPQAFQVVGQPIPPLAPPTLLPGTPAPAPGFTPWVPNASQQPAHWAGAHPGLFVLWVPQAYPWAAMGYASPQLCQATHQMVAPQPPPPVAESNWRPPVEPLVTYPDEVDREDDEDWVDAEHPDVCIETWTNRAGLWCEKEPSIAKSLQMQSLIDFTRVFLNDFLQPDWFQGDEILTHARRFVPDFSPSDGKFDHLYEFRPNFFKTHKKLLCWIMLDFLHVNPDVTESVVTEGFERARELGCLRYFEKLLIREMKVPLEVLSFWKGSAVSPLADDEGL